MTRNQLEEEILRIFYKTEGNYIESIPQLGGEGLTLYAEPIFGIGSADDPLFEEYRQEGIIGPWFMGPTNWLTDARSVISVFFPFTDRVKASNAIQTGHASVEWLYARIEGQAFITKFTRNMTERLTGLGISCCAPSIDPRFALNKDPIAGNWSERHCGYVCGLGTFGMSRGLITRKGMAGRFSSFIISEALDAYRRDYTGIYDYCIKCGACAKRCPAHAFPDNGIKDNPICMRFVDHSKELFAPRYGCGLCQTGVPCESSIP